MCTNVLNTAARNNDPRLATDVSRVLAGRTSKLDIHHYEALIEAYAGSSDLKSALHILSIMRKSGLEPSEATTRPIYARLQKWKHPPFNAWKLLEGLYKDGKAIPIAAINVVLEAYVFHGNLRDAVRQYNSLRKICPSGPSTTTFNIILQGCSKGEGNKDTAMLLASEMVNRGVRPDALTYDRLILACLTEDDYEDAFKYLREMKAMFAASELRMGTWTALVKKCVGAGDSRAWDLLEELNGRGTSTERLKSWMEGAWKRSVDSNQQRKLSGAQANI
jgi:pentatricopeptide repeat protein